MNLVFVEKTSLCLCVSVLKHNRTAPQGCDRTVAETIMHPGSYSSINAPRVAPFGRAHRNVLFGDAHGPDVSDPCGAATGHNVACRVAGRAISSECRCPVSPSPCE